jgi:KAP family P-loop domain protein
MNCDNNSIEKNTQDYPRFISNQPCGLDKTEGHSQERLSNAIAEHITATDSRETNNNIPRIIGLKGEWGVGKSNVIRQLQENEKIKGGYYIFEYDAWGHQEDLQRRSFLETLTTELIDKGLLTGEITVCKKDGKEETIAWHEKLKYLLASKRKIETETRPKLNDSFVLFILATILTPISVSIANINSIQEKCCWLSILLPFIPLIFSCIILLSRKKRWKRLFTQQLWRDIINEVVSIYNGTIKNDISYETVSEEEPSVIDFRKWMQDISDNIGKSNKKLIVVYDNMDRLPADKVKELWSSIHTFFSENGFPNIWVIIPFDEKHLSCAFGESNDKEQLTKHFINKTFPIVYRVKPPFITDYEVIFDTLFNEAFGTTEEEETKKSISRIFRLEKPNATIREMIEFINQLVVMKSIWKQEVELLFCAIFKIKEKIILQNPVSQILSGSYLEKYITKIVPNSELLQKNIAAITYGVSLDIAEQIPMRKYIELCFDNNGTDIKKYSKSPKFIPILQETIQNADPAKTDGIIKCLLDLKTDSFSDSDKNTITALWDILAERKESQELSEQKFDDSYKSLLLNITDKQGLVKRLCQQLQKFGDNNLTKIFSGTHYYKALKDLQDFLSDENIDINITDYLEDIEKEPQIFVEYVQAAKENYKTFKLSTDNDKLNDFLECYDHTIQYFPILKYLKDDPRYKFDTLKQKIESFIPTSGLNAKNFKPIFDAYKLLSNDKPLKKQLLQNQINQIANSLSKKVDTGKYKVDTDEYNVDTDEYLEIAAMSLANNQDVARELNEQEIEYIATQIEYYGDYERLLMHGNNPNLNKVLKYMLENRLGHRLSLENVMPNFHNIKFKIDVSEPVLLTLLDSWNKDMNEITKDNIYDIIPADLFRYSKKTINELTNHINKTAIEALAAIDENTLEWKLSRPTEYWYEVAYNLIDTSFCKPLPENLFNIGIRYLNEIASQGIIPKDNDVKAKIINKLDKRKTGSTIEKIRDSFCNSQSDITPQKFQYLEIWLRQQGKLNNRAGEVIHRIIDPIINDENCLKLLVDNSDFYAKIINAAGDDASATKQTIQQKVNTSEDAKLIAFAEKIGVNKE